MIEIKVDTYKCHIEAGGASKIIAAELSMATHSCIKTFAEIHHMSFDAAVLALFQMVVSANKKATDLTKEIFDL